MGHYPVAKKCRHSVRESHLSAMRRRGGAHHRFIGSTAEAVSAMHGENEGLSSDTDVACKCVRKRRESAVS
jgi:hypothetical protein